MASERCECILCLMRTTLPTQPPAPPLPLPSPSRPQSSSPLHSSLRLRLSMLPSYPDPHQGVEAVTNLPSDGKKKVKAGVRRGEGGAVEQREGEGEFLQSIYLFIYFQLSCSGFLASSALWKSELGRVMTRCHSH